MHKLKSAKINASIRFFLDQIPLLRNYVVISSSLLGIIGIPVEVEMGVNFSPIQLPILPNLEFSFNSSFLPRSHNIINNIFCSSFSFTNDRTTQHFLFLEWLPNKSQDLSKYLVFSLFYVTK